jgi:hypothetical protein
LGPKKKTLLFGDYFYGEILVDGPNYDKNGKDQKFLAVGQKIIFFSRGRNCRF